MTIDAEPDEIRDFLSVISSGSNKQNRGAVTEAQIDDKIRNWQNLKQNVRLRETLIQIETASGQNIKLIDSDQV